MFLAGVTGPCPKCSVTITAPLTNSPQQTSPPPRASAAALSVNYPPRGTTAPVAHAEPLHRPSRYESPRPEPEAISSHIAEKFSLTRRILRIAIPSTILLLIAIGLVNLSHYLKANSLTQPAKPGSTQPLKSSLDLPSNQAKKPIAPLSTKSTNPPLGATQTVTSPESPTAIKVTPPTSPAPEEENKPQAGAVASQVVEQFLAASSFGQRMMYVLTTYSPEDLQNSILAVKWPTAQFNPGTQISHPSERLTEFYFEVRFGENSIGFPREAILLVHKRGDEDPKIVLEPLLDTLGGRLRNFASAPVSKSSDFYVIMDARVKCIDNRIPNAEKKCTFFLRSHTTGQDIATAYANEASPVRAEFDNPLTGLKWKNPMPVVVTLQWNTTEDYARPFLEVIEIKAKNWNP